MTTLQQALERFIDETQIGVYGTADSCTSTTLTHANQFENNNFSGNEYMNWWVHRSQTTTAADNVRPVGSSTQQSFTPSTGALLNGGANWADTTHLYYRLTQPDWHPTRYLVPLANRALELAWQWYRQVITPGSATDFDFQATGVTNWTASNVTRTKDTGTTWGGTQSLKIVTSSAGGYAESAAIPVAPARNFKLTVKAYATIGTPLVTIRDATNSADIVSATVTAPASAASWMEIMVIGAFPANCTNAKIRFGGVNNGDTVYYSEPSFYWNPMTRFALPSWLTQWRDEEGEDAARIYYEKNRLGYTNDWQAQNYDLAIVSPDKYQIVQQPSAVNSLFIEAGRAMTDLLWPLTLEARRPFSDFGSVSADTDTSGCPLRLWVAAMKAIAAEELQLPQRSKLHGGDGSWQYEYNREQRRVASLLQTPAPDSRGMAWVAIR